MIDRLTREERETIYHIDDITGACIADTTIPKDIRSLKKKGWKVIGTQYYSDGTILAMQFEAPRKYLTIRKYDPDSPKRKLSEEHKAKLVRKST